MIVYLLGARPCHQGLMCTHSFIPDNGSMRSVLSRPMFHSEGNGGPQRCPETVHICRALSMGTALGAGDTTRNKKNENLALMVHTIKS